MFLIVRGKNYFRFSGSGLHREMKRTSTNEATSSSITQEAPLLVKRSRPSDVDEAESSDCTQQIESHTEVQLRNCLLKLGRVIPIYRASQMLSLITMNFLNKK